MAKRNTTLDIISTLNPYCNIQERKDFANMINSKTWLHEKFDTQFLILDIAHQSDWKRSCLGEMGYKNGVFHVRLLAVNFNWKARL